MGRKAWKLERRAAQKLFWKWRIVTEKNVTGTEAGKTSWGLNFQDKDFEVYF